MIKEQLGHHKRDTRYTILNSLFITLLLCSSNAAMAACVTTVPATTPTEDFTNHGNGTVTHIKTGLMWKQCPEGASGAACGVGGATFYSWQNALKAAETLNAAGGFAGFTDWRVPNIKELASIVERQCTFPAINATIFPNPGGTIRTWSSSPSAAIGASVWATDFKAYGISTEFSKTSIGYVRLVRGGL